MIRASLAMICLALCLAGAMAGCRAAEAEVAQDIAIPEVPALSVTLEPPEARTSGWWVQGQLVLTVRVASKHPFEALDLELPAIADAETIVLVKPRTRKIESYAGEGSVLETVLAIFPRRPGRLDIPAVRVTGSVAPEPDAELAFDDASAPMAIRVAGIDPGYDDPWWMVSPRVEIAETWSAPPEQAHVGDILRRTVAVTAFGVTAERIRISEDGRTPTVQVAEADATSRTEITADGVIGHATRAWDLKIGSGGVVYVGPIGVAYWDPLAQEQRRAALPARRLEPLPADSAAMAERLMAEARGAHDAERALATGLALLASLPILCLALAGAWIILPGRADRRFSALCSGRPSPEALYRGALDWQRETALDAAALHRLAGPLERSLFAAGGTTVDAGDLRARLLRAARRRRARIIAASVSGALTGLVGKSTRLTGDAPPRWRLGGALGGPDGSVYHEANAVTKNSD